MNVYQRFFWSCLLTSIIAAATVIVTIPCFTFRCEVGLHISQNIVIVNFSLNGSFEFFIVEVRGVSRLNFVTYSWLQSYWPMTYSCSLSTSKMNLLHTHNVSKASHKCSNNLVCGCLSTWNVDIESSEHRLLEKLKNHRWLKILNRSLYLTNF